MASMALRYPVAMLMVMTSDLINLYIALPFSVAWPGGESALHEDQGKTNLSGIHLAFIGLPGCDAICNMDCDQAVAVAEPTLLMCARRDEEGR